MSPRGPRRRIGRGLYEDRSGIDAEVQVKGLKDHARFPRTARGRDDAKAWQDKTRATLRRRAKAAPAGPFMDDVRRYLAAVKSMPTYAEREQHMEEWAAVFAHRRRDSLSAAEIRAQLELWKAEHGWSASALNHRRTALQHFYSVMEGKSGENVVRDVPRFKEPDALPRGLPWATIRAILRAMPPSVTRLRLALIAWTGLPHATLGRLTRGDVDFRHKTLRRPGRKKGRGTTVKIVPLARRALWYFRLMDRCEGWGPFDRWHTRREFRKACRNVEAAAAERGEVLDLSDVRPYDLRHSFGTLVYASTHDLATTAELMGTSLATARRYTLAAVPTVLTAAVAKIEAKIRKNPTPAPDPDQASPAESPRLLAFSRVRP